MFSCLNEICEIGEGESLPLNLNKKKWKITYLTATMTKGKLYQDKLK